MYTRHLAHMTDVNHVGVDSKLEGNLSIASVFKEDLVTLQQLMVKFKLYSSYTILPHSHIVHAVCLPLLLMSLSIGISLHGS